MRGSGHSQPGDGYNRQQTAKSASSSCRLFPATHRWSRTEIKINAMIPKVKFDRKNTEWRRFVAWVIGSLAMPLTAHPFVAESISRSDIDLPIILIFGVCWIAVSALLWIYIKKNVH